MNLYRYKRIIGEDEDDTSVILLTYQVIKETKKGYWFNLHGVKKKWTSKSAKRRYAHTTKIEALESFITRSSNYIGFLNFFKGCTLKSIQIAEGKLMELKES